MIVSLHKPISDTPYTGTGRLIRRSTEVIDPPDHKQFHVASTVTEAFEAWRLVYNVYVHSGFIFPNDDGIHTVPQAFNRRSAVFFTKTSGKIDGSLTAMLDGPGGLPLDSVYSHTLDALRQRGRKLSEHGLLAHSSEVAGSQAAECFGDNQDGRRRIESVRSSLIHLMCRTVFYSLATNCTDVVIGVHPKHTRFYRRAWGFETDGPVTTYPLVNHRPVVLMRLDFAEVLARDTVPYALDYLLNNPIPLQTFTDRCRFEPTEIAQHIGTLGAYLQSLDPQRENCAMRWALRKVS
jgi:hypothetical protein